jgi:hypothetical protein
MPLGQSYTSGLKSLRENYKIKTPAASQAAENLKKSSFRGMLFPEESLFPWV